MGEMKSAFEKAMEKIENLEKASPEELRRLDSLPKGDALGAKYLSGECSNLSEELEKHDADLRVYLKEGIERTLLRNIALPQTEHDRLTTKKALDGLTALKKDKARAKNVAGKIQQLCDYYEQTLQHTYSQLKQATERKLIEAMNQSGRRFEGDIGTAIESQPRFQEQWHLAMVELGAQYGGVLAEHKQELQNIR